MTGPIRYLAPNNGSVVEQNYFILVHFYISMSFWDKWILIFVARMPHKATL